MLNIEILLWLSLTFYTVCFFPQIVKNYRAKSTEGLSDLFLLSYYIAYGAMLYYIFHCNLTLPYKIILPIEMTVLTSMIMQKLYYHGFAQNKWFFIQFLSLNAIMIGLYPISLYCPYEFGMAGGWVAFVFFAIYPIPQVLKLYRTKSVEGFSFGFISVQALAFLSEGIVAVIKQLPLPTLFMVAKGFVFYAIFSYQFWLYRKR